MNRSCEIVDRQLVEFAQGAALEIDEHVATCEECQDFLAELWSGGLDHDISEPVIRAIRLELWVMEIAKAAFDIAGRMGKAASTYLGGADESDGQQA